jgi:hypothetical protein
MNKTGPNRDYFSKGLDCGLITGNMGVSLEKPPPLTGI